jgi:cytoskeletal protein RodZ
MPLLQPLRESVSRTRNRALIVLLVVAIHILLLSLLWHALHQPLPNRPSIQVARADRSQTIVFLLEPYAPAAIKPRREEPRRDAHATQTDPKRDTATPVPVYGSEVSNAAALASAVAPAIHEDSAMPTPAQSASAPLNLSDDVMRSAVAQSKGAARKLVEISGQQVNKLKLTQIEQLAATIAEAGVPDCVRLLKFDPPAIESEESTRQLLSETRGPSSGRNITIPILPAAALIHAAATGKCKF